MASSQWSISDFQNGSLAWVRIDDSGPQRQPVKAFPFVQPAVRFKEARHDVDGLLREIERGDIALPTVQRAFVWPSSKVRDLLDSMYRGFPVGSLMLWSTLESKSVKQIGLESKQRLASQLVIDGQQRLTSLYAVLRGKPVIDENYQVVDLEIAFRPGDGRFEVPDAAIRRDPEFVPNISELWTSGKPAYRIIKDFVERLKTKRALSAADEDAVSHNLGRLMDITKYPFTTLEIDRDVDEEAVADIFVRINNGGTKLGQSDFILTLLSVFSPDTRRSLEDFARQASVPATKGEASPYNHLIDPKPDQMVRVAVAVGFYRAKLSAVYQLLRGRNPDTDEMSSELRDKQFQRLAEAVQKVLDITSWHLFIGCIVGAGFRSSALISSETALLYSYALYLIGRLQYGVDEKTLGRLIARWFFATSLSARYSGSSETVMEEDLSLVRDLKDAAAFVRALEGAIDSELTNDFWEITVPQELETSSVNSPVARAFQVAQIKLGAPVLFSDRQISHMYDPLIQAKRKTIEGHHLFPKAWLRATGINDTKRINQAANLANVEWPDNVDVSDSSPAEYVPELRKQFSAEIWDSMCALHALPLGWEALLYDQFLIQRRRLMAKIIRRGFEALSGKDVPAIDLKRSAGIDERETWALVDQVEVELRKLVRLKYAAKWGAGAEARLRKVFSENEQADFELRRKKHLDAYPLSPGQIVPGDFLDYLYLGDVARLVTASETWDQFSPLFDKRKDLLQGKLQQILPVRNDRAHFRPVPENELLRCRLACSDLLAICNRAIPAAEHVSAVPVASSTLAQRTGSIGAVTEDDLELLFAGVIEDVKRALPEELATFKNTQVKKPKERWTRFHWRNMDVHVGLWAGKTPRGHEISVYFFNGDRDPRIVALLQEKIDELRPALGLDSEDLFEPPSELAIDKQIDKGAAAETIAKFLKTLKPLLGGRL